MRSPLLCLRDFFLCIAAAALVSATALAGPLPVTIVSGLAANDKQYDGTTAALIRSNNVVLVGIEPADVGNVALSTNNYVATFSDINVGTGKSVTVTGLHLTGSAAGKYVLSPTFLQLTADIDPALVFVVSGLTANSKVYDGSSISSLSSNNVVLAGVVPWEADFVALSTNGYFAAFPSPAAGQGRDVIVVGLTLTGFGANNYLLIQPLLHANISPKTVTISSGLAANDKVFDGTTTATLSSNTVALAGVLAGDVSKVALSTNNYSAAFANTGPGDGIPVSVSGLTLTGIARGNYSLTQPTLSANIAPLLPVIITSGIVANSKAYDGTATATLRSNNVVLTGIAHEDVGKVALSTNNYIATFSDINVGTGKSVIVTGLHLTGSAAGKYVLNPTSLQLTADIIPAPVMIFSGLTANDKVYDGTRTATISSNNVVLGGVLPWEAALVALSTNNYSAAFDSPNVISSIRPVAVEGLTLTGSAAGNYELYSSPLLADISPAPVTISLGLTANDKVFDGTATASLSSNSVVLAGVFAGDTAHVALSTNGYAAAFASPAAGLGLSVTVSGLTLTGSASGNYSLAQPTLTGNISAAPVTIGSSTSFTNSQPISINDISPASPYPSTIVVSGVPRVIEKVTVTLLGFWHSWPYDVGVLLVSPSGQKLVLMNRAFLAFPSLSGVNLTFDQSTSNGRVPASSALATGSYQPYDYKQGIYDFYAPAPRHPYATSLDAFNGSDPNGTWELYVMDDIFGDDGQIAGGWHIDITSAVPGLAADNKVYDGTTTATLSSNNVVLLGVLPNDTGHVALSTNGYTATFASSSVGLGQSVAVSGLMLTGDRAGNYLLTQPNLVASISASAVSISSGLTADDKVYDGTATASLSSNNVVLAGVLAADVDNVALSTNGYAATFAGWGVGPGQSVTVSGLTLTGSAGGNYLLTQLNLVANINARPVSIASGLEADNKFYDGTTTATLSSNSVVLAGVLAADASSVALSTNNYTATFASSAFGPGQSVTVSGLALSGFAADNYFLVQPSLAANIDAAPVTISSGLTANDKIYDGTTAATLSSNNVVLTGIVAAEAGNVDLSTNGYTATFASAAVGPGQIVTVSGLALTGPAAGNYSIIQPSLAADIAGIPVTIDSGLTANNKPYDGTAIATLSSNNVVLAGVQLADVDNVSLSTNGYTAAFDSSAIGSGQNVAVSGLTLTGSAAGHYSLSQPSLVADITGAPVTIISGLLANDKIYDGTTSATLSSNGVVLAGVVAADVDNVSISTNGYTASFADSTAAVGKSVTVNGLTLTGSAASHYTLAQPAPTATIAPAPLVVTADNVSRLYGALNPSISGNITGGQNGDLIIARFVAQADPSSPVGVYPIAVGLSTDSSTLANYNVTTNLGFLEVLPAPLTITASNTSRAYGAPNPTFAGTINGLMNGDNITATYTCTADTTNAPGIYPIFPAVVSPANLQTNYLVTLVNGTLTIMPTEFVLALTQTGDSVLLRWSAIAGQRYQVQYSINASPLEWSNLVTLTATNSAATASDTINATAHRFYRTIWLP